MLSKHLIRQDTPGTNKTISDWTNIWYSECVQVKDF